MRSYFSDLFKGNCSLNLKERKGNMSLKLLDGTPPVVTVERVCIRYNEFLAVDDVSLHIHRGEIIGLLGPNGAGKTSLLEALEGIQKPASGSVSVLGHAPGKLPPSRRGELAFVFQRSALPGHASVSQLMDLYSRVFPNCEFGRQIAAVMGLNHLQESCIGDLSVGQRQRLSVFCALYGKPSMLIMDEPTSSLDIRSRRAVWDAVLQLKRQGGMSGIIATHDMTEAMELCDRVYFIEAGKICGEMTPGQEREHSSARLSIRFAAPDAFLANWPRLADAALTLQTGAEEHCLDCPKIIAAELIADIFQAELDLGFDARLTVRQTVIEQAYLKHISKMG